MGGHVACVGMRNGFKILVRKLQGRDYLGDLGIDGRTM